MRGSFFLSCFSAVLLVTNLQGCTEEEFNKQDTCMGIVDGICERSADGYEVLDKANMEERKARFPAFELECAGYGLTNKGLGRNGDAGQTPLYNKCIKCAPSERELTQLAICTASHTAAGATSASESARAAVNQAQAVPVGGDLGSASQEQAAMDRGSTASQPAAQPGMQPGVQPGVQRPPGASFAELGSIEVPANGHMEPRRSVNARPVNQ